MWIGDLYINFCFSFVFCVHSCPLCTSCTIMISWFKVSQLIIHENHENRTPRNFPVHVYYGTCIIIFQGFDGCCSHWQWKDSGLPCSCSGAALQTQLHAKKWYVAALCTSILHVRTSTLIMPFRGILCIPSPYFMAMCTSIG